MYNFRMKIKDDRALTNKNGGPYVTYKEDSFSKPEDLIDCMKELSNNGAKGNALYIEVSSNSGYIKKLNVSDEGLKSLYKKIDEHKVFDKLRQLLSGFTFHVSEEEFNQVRDGIEKHKNLHKLKPLLAKIQAKGNFGYKN